MIKIATGLLIVISVTAVAYSSLDAYNMVARDQIHIPLQEATDYAAKNLNENQSILVICPFNLFNQDMVKYYFGTPVATKQTQVLQYPELPVDAFTPNFNVTELIQLCEQNNVKYILDEYGSYVPYFNTTLDLVQVFNMIYDSGKFSQITNETSFGANPRRIFIMSFNP